MNARLPRSRRLRTLPAVLGLVAVVALAAACVPPPPDAPPADPPSVYDAACAGTLVPSTPGTVTNAALDEISGIVASRRNPGVWWVHNDSGNAADVYAIGGDGHLVGMFGLSGATNVDWEDVAVGPGPASGVDYLYLADIGGAPAPPLSSDRTSVQVYRVPEPDASAPGPVGGVETLTFTYPNGDKYDAEAVMVDPISGKLYVVTKELAGAKVFEAPENLPGGSNTELAEVASIGTGLVTGADVTPAGDFVALRTYASVIVYPRPAGGSLAAAFAQAPCAGATAAENQGEAIGFTTDGRGYVTVSEGTNPPLHRFDAP